QGQTHAVRNNPSHYLGVSAYRSNCPAGLMRPLGGQLSGYFATYLLPNPQQRTKQTPRSSNAFAAATRAAGGAFSSCMMLERVLIEIEPRPIAGAFSHLSSGGCQIAAQACKWRQWVHQ